MADGPRKSTYVYVSPSTGLRVLMARLDEWDPPRHSIRLIQTPAGEYWRPGLMLAPHGGPDPDLNAAYATQAEAENAVEAYLSKRFG